MSRWIAVVAFCELIALAHVRGQPYLKRLQPNLTIVDKYRE
jgi:hypothetical protein